MAAENKHLNDFTDDELWDMLRAGSKDAFEQLYFRYYDKLFNYAVSFCRNRAMAEDHIQSLFLKIWDRKNSLNSVKFVKTYLWVALRRSLVDELQKKQVVEKDNLTVKKDFRIAASPEDLILLHEHSIEQVQRLYSAIESLTPRQREILFLKYFEGMSYKEIEAITTLKYQTVRNHIHESVKTLKTAFQESDENMLFSHAAICTLIKIIAITI